MADAVRMEIQGLADLERRMRQLGPKLAKNALRSAVNAGAQVIKKEAQARAPENTGKLKKKAIYVTRSREESSDSKQTYKVAVRMGRKEQKKGRDAYYWWWVEFGTKAHLIKAKISKVLSGGGETFGREMHHPGTKPRPFLAPAFEAKKMQALERIKQKLKQRLDALTNG